MYLYSFGWTNLFELFSCALNIGNYNGDVPVIVGLLVDGIVVISTIVIVSVIGIVYVVGILVEVVVSFKFLLKLIKCPRRELACLEGPPDVI